MSKIRIYELAREVGIPNKDLVEKVRTLGYTVKNHMSSLTVEDASSVRKSLGVSGKAAPARSAKPATRRRASSAAAEPAEKPKAVRPMVRRRKVQEPEPVAAPVTPAPAVEAPVAQAASAPTLRPIEPAPVAAPVHPAPVEPEYATPVSATPMSTPAAMPAPIEPAVATPAPQAVAAEAAVAHVQADEPTPTATKIKVVVEGPPVVNLPGHQVRPKPAPAPAPEAPAVAVAPAPAPATPVGAKERFQAELERARDLASQRDQEREAAKKQKLAAQEVAAPPREDGRPAVGTVIKLPTTRIKVVERPLAARGAKDRLRGRFAQEQQRGRRRDVRRKTKPKGSGRQTQITTPAEHKRIVRIEETTTVAELGKNMGIKAQELLKKLWGLGMVGISLNASIDIDTAQLLANEFGYEVHNVAFKEGDVFASDPDEDSSLVTRAPVVTVMGHVDHGKTSLLDYIRDAKVASGESGGITQHIGAYKVDAGEGYGEIVFIDTPGHAAFSEMRARGAQCTDIVILICAADDGVMPQTAEAVKHAKAAEVTIIVAVNKCDLPGANPERVRQQLADHGLIPEEWGGDTIYVDCSAKTGEGVDKLLESISVNAELMELKANPNKSAVGTVIEARLDRARGPISTILIQEGTLRPGDTVVVGEYMGKVRAALDHAGNQIESAGPSTPVELLGIDGVPGAGETLNVTEDEKKAKQVVEARRQQKRKKELATSGRVSLGDLMSNIQSGSKHETLKVILKADVQGSAEALKKSLIDLSTEKVVVDVISVGVGGITETDVNLATTGSAIVVGFHVRTAGKASQLAEKEGVEIKIYDIIYDCIDDVKAAMEGLLSPIQREVEQGRMEVRDTFTIPRRGVVAGCMVTQGRVARKSLLRVIRESVQVYEGRVSSLRRFKDEAAEVKEGFECGLMLDGYNDLQIGDIIESYEIVEEKATL